MTPIRAFERADLAAVASLYERVSRSGSRTAAPGLAAYLERALLDQPWRDPEIPSLVYEVDGRITAFLGVHLRPLRFDARPIRLAVFGQLVSDPDVRGRPGGALLLRHALAGRQDVSIAYFAPQLARMWESLGGRSNYISSVEWFRVLRPAAFLAELAVRRTKNPTLERLAGWVRRKDARATSRRGLLLDRLAFDAGPDAFAAQGQAAEPLTPAAVVEHLPSLTDGFRIRPDYDIDSLAWLLEQVRADTTRGVMDAHLVRSGRGDVLGWYIVRFERQRVCRVIALVARPADAGAVLDQLVAHAHSRAAVVLAGRLEPQLAGAVWERPIFLRAIAKDVVHARDADALGTILGGRALITALEGEDWMGHQSTPVPPAGSGIRDQP